MPGLEHESHREQHEADPRNDGAGDLEHEEPGGHASREQKAADEDHQPRDAELGEQRLPESALRQRFTMPIR